MFVSLEPYDWPALQTRTRGEQTKPPQSFTFTFRILLNDIVGGRLTWATQAGYPLDVIGVKRILSEAKRV